MDSGGFVVSAEALIRIFVVLLYVPIFGITYFQLFRRLSPTSRRLAFGMLAAQVLVIVLALEIRPASYYEWWLWHLDLEYNIPATLASTQLALVGGVALVTARLARTRPAWQRLYLVAVGLVFLYLARDEFFTLHERILNWKRYYAALGAVVVATTAVVAARSPRTTRIWSICLLAGLAMSAAGSIIIDARPEPCTSLGFLRLDGCLSLYVGEEALEFLGIWLALVAILGQLSDAAPTPQPRVRRALYALPALWILLIILNSLIPHLELRILAQPASVQYESGVHLRGYHIDTRDGASHLRLYASSRRRDFLGVGYSVHLVDQSSGNSIASRNKNVDRQHGIWLFGPDHVPLYLQWMEVIIPPQIPTNRALWVVLTVWRKQGDEFISQRILSSDHQLLGETQVVLGELVLPAVSDNSVAAPVAVFDNGFTLVSVDLPERGRPGEIMTIPFTWRSEVAGDEDHVQFLHLGHAESGEWWIYDQHPLGRRLPTRLWYSGLNDSETWQVPIPADLAPGSYNIFTGLYRARDNERVPVSDAEGRPWVDARVSLGILTLD